MALMVCCLSCTFAERGTITEKVHTEESIGMAGRTPIIFPEKWEFRLKDKDLAGTVEVSHEAFDRCKVGDTYPDC